MRTRHGKELVRYIAELELGTSYGPTCSVRLIAATLDPAKLDPKSTWYLATSLPLSEASAEQVYEVYRLRDWMEHYYKPAKHKLSSHDLAPNPPGLTQNQVGWPSFQERLPAEDDLASQRMQPT